MGEFTREIVVEATLAELPHVFEFMETTCREARVREDAQFDLQLAVEEACANVIEHAYEAKGGALRITFATRGPDVILTVIDQGPPFDPTSVAAPDLNLPLEERRIGGLGIHLIKRLMDELDYTTTERGNVVRMVKHHAIGENTDA
jgi:serine/threonine-protein kinase RsbW